VRGQRAAFAVSFPSGLLLACVCVSAAGEPWKREDKSAAGSFVGTKFDTSFDLENPVCPLLDFHDTSRIATNPDERESAAISERV